MAGERIDAPVLEILEEENIGNTTTIITRTKDGLAEKELHIVMQLMLKNVPGEPSTFRPITIFRVPACFHEGNKILYEPKMVSIGPYHRGKEEFRAMEEHKWSFLRDFLARNKDVSLEVYVKENKTLETQARQCYSETVDLGSDEFVMMLVLDGCFILEYFLKKKYNQVDALVDTAWAEAGVDTDILLLENQIPFFIIHKLYDIHGGYGPDCKASCPLLELLTQFLAPIALDENFRPPTEAIDQIQHLLHLHHKCMVADLEMEQNVNDLNHSNTLDNGYFSWFMSRFRQSKSVDESKCVAEKEKEEESSITKRFAIMPCICELEEAGVTFKRKRKPRHMFDISFQNGVMEMPFMEIGSRRKIIFSNIVAFEQSQPYELTLIFTSYLALMDALINTEKDVALLQKAGILENLLRNEEDASIFYNRFGDFNTINYYNHYFRGLFDQVHNYSDSVWHKYRAKLMHDYFSNPWTIISVVAGGLLLGVTIVQTYYTIYSSIHN